MYINITENHTYLTNEEKDELYSLFILTYYSLELWLDRLGYNVPFERL